MLQNSELVCVFKLVFSSFHPHIVRLKKIHKQLLINITSYLELVHIFDPFSILIDHIINFSMTLIKCVRQSIPKTNLKFTVWYGTHLVITDFHRG